MIGDGGGRIQSRGQHGRGCCPGEIPKIFDEVGLVVVAGPVNEIVPIFHLPPIGGQVGANRADPADAGVVLRSCFKTNQGGLA